MRQIFMLACVILTAGILGAKYVDLNALPAKDAPRVAMVQPQQQQPQAQPAPRGGRVVTINRSGNGHFEVDARVDGRRVAFMVDTGASVIALNESSAARLGIRVSPRDYTVNVSTANGVIKAAPVTLNSVDIDGVVVRDVRASVLPDEALNVNLLGMSYLSRVRFAHERGKLVIEQ